MGGFGVACAAIEALTMNLAGELGPRHSGRLPPARRNPGDLEPVHGGGQAVRGAEGVPRPPRGPDAAARLPTLAEVANLAVFMASDHASAMTGTVVNLTCGSIPE